MNKLCNLLNLKNEDELFDKIKHSFKEKITKWDYFVNWLKVFSNIKPIEKELNLLNFLIGKEDIEKEAFDLIKQYPEVVKAFPTLIAIREKSVDILIDTKKFIYKNYSFTRKKLTDEECKELAYFVVNSGIGEILRDKKVKNLVDYATGIEVGLDSNGRKNRGGTLMESLVEEFVADTCQNLGLQYLAQATSKKIKQHWGLDVIVDKSSRQLDFAINKNGKLFFIECNFYGGGGSKLKSTATEYIEMNRYWNKQGIEFIWITDGAGWKSTLKPLREYFDKADYLLNLEMLKNNILTEILK
ncbi:type II restriction endonuclease [Arcicella rosea]|uniref:Type-2 restriction enzyme n=1 Tax=Arcicella rosea TaxID=502909 RepID=A0A841EHD6_9BACT|nr:type II restriction endonuclease [Arcicella rosea]MBB6002802.1 type II restriction enzyme [Arcicella rosea]